MIHLLNSAATEWGEFILLALLQNTIFIGLVLAALHLLRSAPARVRYLVALAGLVKLVLPPFLKIPSMPAAAGKAISGYTGLIPFVTETGTSAPAAAAGESISMQGAVLGVWAVVMAAGLAVIVTASARLALKLRGAGEVEPGDIPPISGLEGIRILRSSRIAMPITVAFLPGRIYVPSAWDSWTPQCRRMVLLHEMAHLKRRDGAVLLMQIIAKAIYFFHPLVHVLDSRISEYREMACDDATVGRDRDSSVEYSRYLVEIAESVVRCPAVCGSASALIRRKNELLARVSYQLEEGRMRSISRTRVIVLTAAIALMALSLSWYSGEAGTGDEPPAAPSVPAPASVPSPASAPAPPARENVRPINVLLQADGAKIDDKEVRMDELAAALDIYGGKDPENVVVNLVCADDVSMDNVRFFQETLLKMGIDKISYVNSGGKNLPLQLPPQKALDTLADMPEEMKIHVSVSADGSMKVGKKKVKAGNLADVVADGLSEQPYAVVIIHNEAKTSYGDFTTVLEQVKAAGAERVVVMFGDAK